ncbi:MAG TPA: mitochondrial fission ELM1 family protein [Beijerinckiaceae bacterium]
MRRISAWVLTDGKAGDEQPCLGVAEAMGLAPDKRHVRPRAPFAWLAPWGPIDPRDAPERPSSPISPPFPDLLIASGRRAVPYLRAVKRTSGAQTFTVFLKDPRSGSGTADLIWVSEHDALRGDNVIVTLTTPHRLSPDRLAAARAKPDPRLAALPAPRTAVLVGGDSRHHRFGPQDVERFLADLRSLAESASLMVTASRRTPPLLAEGLRPFAGDPRHFVWDGLGENPYLAILALADAVVATADSTNMIGEAAATGRPILVFEPSGGHAKIARFLDGLRRHGAVHRFAGRLEGSPYAPLDSTPTIAQAVLERLAHHRRRLGLD